MIAVVLKWIPACGKSTLAKKYEKEWYVVINNDTLRKENPKLTEAQIKDMYWNMVAVNKEAWLNIVLDNTHINKKTLQETILRVGAWWYEVQVVDVFLQMAQILGNPWFVLQECLTRNKWRDAYVPESVIYEMYLKDWYGLYQFDFAKDYDMNVVLVDLDGTLYNINHRLQRFEDTGKINWTVFEDPEQVKKDVVVEILVDIINGLAEDNAIIITSGRKNKLCWITLENLKRDGVHYDAILMRQSWDNSPDYSVKKWFGNLIKEKHTVKCVFDDRKQVIDARRELWFYVLNACQHESNDF